MAEDEVLKTDRRRFTTTRWSVFWLPPPTRLRS